MALKAFLPEFDNGPDGPLTNGAPSGPLVSSLPASLPSAAGDAPAIIDAHNSSQNTSSSRMVKIPYGLSEPRWMRTGRSYSVNLKTVFVR